MRSQMKVSERPLPTGDCKAICREGVCRILRKFQRANAALSHMLCMCCRVADELLNGEIFYSLREAQIIIESWRKHYNAKRPHSALG